MEHSSCRKQHRRSTSFGKRVENFCKCSLRNRNSETERYASSAKKTQLKFRIPFYTKHTLTTKENTPAKPKKAGPTPKARLSNPVLVPGLNCHFKIQVKPKKSVFAPRKNIIHKRFRSDTNYERLRKEPLRQHIRNQKSQDFDCDQTLKLGSQAPPCTERTRIISLVASSFRETGLPPTTNVSFYKLGKQLGKGAFGKVYLGIHKMTNLKVALKTIAQSYIKDERVKRKVQQEVFVMNRVKHPNVVRLVEVFESSRHLMIVTEYAGGGDLLQLVKNRHRLPESEAKMIFKQLIEAVTACHAKHIAHRDIKLDNILITTDFSTVKLCDFGVSRMVKPGETVVDQCGTPAYLAPEIVGEGEYEPLYVDLWGMGILLYAMVCGDVPFKAKTLPELHKLILVAQPEYPSFLSEEIKDFIAKMLNIVPRNRISLEEMKTHEWFCCEDGEIDPEDSGVPRFQGALGTHSNSSGDQRQVLLRLRELGFPPEYVIQSLLFKDINHATATYHLIELHSKVNKEP